MSYKLNPLTGDFDITGGGLTEADADARYINITGDSMAGDLEIVSESVSATRLGDGSALAIGDSPGQLGVNGVSPVNGAIPCNILHSSSFAGLTQFSLCFWVYTKRPTTPSARWVQKGNGGATMLCRMYRSGGNAFYQFGTGVSTVGFTGARTMAQFVNAWNWVYIERDAVGTCRAYVNNTLEGSVVAAGAIPTTTESLSIGDRGGDDVMSGWYDQFLFYNRVLTSAERSNLYNAGNGIYSVPASGLSCRLEFDSYLSSTSVASTFTVPDLSGNNNFATVNAQLCQFVPGKTINTTTSATLNAPVFTKTNPTNGGVNAVTEIGNNKNDVIINAWRTEIKANTPIKLTQERASDNILEIYTTDGKLKNYIGDSGAFYALHAGTTGSKTIVGGFDGNNRAASIAVNADRGGGQASIKFNCEFAEFSNGFIAPVRIDGNGSCLIANSVAKVWTEASVYFHLYNFASDSYNVPSTTRFYVAPPSNNSANKAFALRQHTGGSLSKLFELQTSAGVATLDATEQQINFALSIKKTPTVVNNASYTQVLRDNTIIYSAITAARTVTLLATATLTAGATLVIGDESGNCNFTNTITIDANASETINGVATLVLNSAYSHVVLRVNSTATGWVIESLR